MTTWQLFPTATRRFQHSVGISLRYNKTKDTWSAHVAVQHSEVRPSSSWRDYNNITTRQAERIMRLAARNNMTLSFNDTGKVMWFFYRKPVPVCATMGCSARVSVPTYQDDHYHCVNHRPVKETTTVKYIITHDPGNKLIFKQHGHFGVAGYAEYEHFSARSNDFWSVFNYAVKNAIVHKLTSIEISWQLWPE